MLDRMKRRGFQLSRDSLLFGGGMIGVGYETVFTKGERPGLLFLFGAMMGLPAFLRMDEKRSASAPDPPPEPEPPEPPKKKAPARRSPPKKKA